MHDIFKYEKRNKYPHMKPADVAIWERFIEKFPKAYGSVQYDLHVGDPPPFSPMGENGEDMNQDALYRLKIDVIGRNADHVDIIEIKPKAGPSTIGQVKGYRALYIRDEEPKVLVKGVIVTDQLRPNIEFLAKQEGVKIIVV